MYSNVVLVTQPMGNEHPAWTGETATPSLVYPACPVTTLQKALYASTTVGTVHGDRVWGPEWHLPGCAQSSPGFMPPFSFFFLCNATISLSLLNSPTEGTMLSQGSSLLVSWYVVFTAGEGQLQGLREGGNHLLKHSIWIWRHWNQSVITVVFQAYTPMSKDSQGIPLCPVVSLSNPS